LGTLPSVGDEANTHQPTPGASLYIASSPKKVAANLFILQGGAEPFSSAPVWAEPSQLLLGMSLFGCLLAGQNYDANISRAQSCQSAGEKIRSAMIKAG
jgi:hypothetical protein